MDKQLKWQKEEKKSILEQIEQMGYNLEDVLEKNRDQQKVIEELEKDKHTMELLNQQVQGEYQILNEELRKKNEQISCLEDQNAESLKRILLLEQDIAS